MKDKVENQGEGIDLCERWRERIIAFADGEAMAQERVEVQAHFAVCAECTRFLTEVQGVYKLAWEGDVTANAAVPDVSDGVTARLAQESLLMELRGMRNEMAAMREEMRELQKEVSRLRILSSSSPSPRSSGVFLMPYASPQDAPPLLGMKERN